MSSVENATDDGVFAINTEGAWTVTGSEIFDNGRHGISATNATIEGDATGNYRG